jgi:multiple sugar transport system substrate-binding protein
MSGEATDTQEQLFQFMAAYDADYVTSDGRLVIGDPEVRRRLIEAIDAYTAIYRKGCTPPSSVTWDSNRDNNEQFLAQAVVMVLNDSLSIPNALKRERPHDYHDNTATIEWPDGADGQPLAIRTTFNAAAAFKAAGHIPLAKEFVRFLVQDGWLMHYLDFSGERLLPSMPKLLEQPFWLDPSDRHHMAAVMQAQSRPVGHNYTAASGELGHDQIYNEHVWAKAVHRVAAEGWASEQVVDEAISRIKQILAE